jgi:AcrR family transcriptional regulator
MGRRKTYDRDTVLEKAMDLFWKVGFEGAHMAKLVEATGLNRFSLYKEFGGKSGLFEEALERYLVTAQAVYDTHLGREPYGLDNIRAYFAATSSGADYHGCFMINTLTERFVVSKEAFDMALRFSKASERLYLKNLQAARSCGDLPEDADVKIMARALLAFDEGLAIYGIVQPSVRGKQDMTSWALQRLLGG